MSASAWLYHLLKGDRILISYSMDPDTHRFSRDLFFAHVTEAQAYGMGFQRGIKILDELKYSPFKVYVRFNPDAPPGIPLIKDESGNLVQCFETSSTLYDYWRSDASERFLFGMTTKKAMSLLDMKKLIMIGVVIAAAVAGVLLLM